MPEEEQESRKTLKNAYKTAGLSKGCRAQCNEKYDIGSEEWEQCMRDCQEGKTIG